MRGSAAWLRGQDAPAERHRGPEAPQASTCPRSTRPGTDCAHASTPAAPLPHRTATQVPAGEKNRSADSLGEEAVAWSGPKEGGDRDATACTSADLVFHHQTPNLLFLRCFLKCDPNRLRRADLGACGKARPGAVPGPRSRHFRADSGLGAVARPPTLEASVRASGITARHVLTFRFDTKGCSHLFSSLYVLSKFYVFTV